jgi:hypothetical protein
MYNGKSIYNPSGKAGEYSQLACNFYVGCSNGCTYCYCKKGILAGTMGQDKPQLKKCFRDTDHAFKIFWKEMIANKSELQKHGLFFSFTTDPLLPETQKLTFEAMQLCFVNFIPVKILTKCTKWIEDFNFEIYKNIEHEVAIGFTLTGHDELEPGAPTNAERIEAMAKLHHAGFRTWASIEPVIEIGDSIDMILTSMPYCDHYKIGLLSGKKYHKHELITMVHSVNRTIGRNAPQATIYWKDELLHQAGIERDTLPSNCVGRNYEFTIERNRQCPVCKTLTPQVRHNYNNADPDAGHVWECTKCKELNNFV